VAKKLRVTLEMGPKNHRFAAVAPDWPGLERGATTPEAAVEALESYIPRYAGVAKLARMQADYAVIKGVNVVERYEGVGSTDFWGISFACSSADGKALSREALTRQLTLMRACWTFFDAVRERVSADMQKGSRGGGRDRDTIVLHVLGNEQEWGKKVGIPSRQGARVTDAEGIKAWRAAYCRAIRTLHAEGRTARKWPLTYLIRHTAFHTMDHAWEMEDKDLSGGVASR
jgi:hypothetical protein